MDKEWIKDRGKAGKEGNVAVAEYKIILDGQFTVVQASAEYAEMTGYSFSEIYSNRHAFIELLSDKAFAFMQEMLRRDGVEGKKFSFYQEILSKDKKTLQVINSGTYQTAETGETFFAGILTDVSAQYRKNKDTETLLNCIDMPLIRFLPDEDGTLIYYNKAFCDLVGYSAEEIKANLHNSVKAFFHEDFHRWLLGDTAAALGSENEITRNIGLINKDRMPLTVTFTKKCMISGTGELNIIGMMDTSNSYVQSEPLHKRRQKDWIAMWEALSDDYICTYDYEKDLLTVPEKSRWQRNGERYIRNYVKEIHQRKTLHPSDVEGFLLNVIETSMSDGKVLTYELKSRIFTKNYEWYRLYYTTCHKEGAQGRMLVGRLVSIDAEKRESSILGSRGDIDVRTGLLSQTAFYETLEYYLLREGKQGRHAFFKVRLENFSQLQERFGHLFADVVIDSFASYMKSAFRKTDILGRISENVFLILMKDVMIEEVEARAKAICVAFTKTYMVGPSEIGVGSNIGISFFPEDGVSGEDLYGKAVKAIQHAKRSGQNHYVMFKNLVEREENEPQELETELDESFTRQSLWQYDKALLTYAVQVISMSKDTESAIDSAMERIGRQFNLDLIVIVMKEDGEGKNVIFHLWQSAQAFSQDWRDLVFSRQETDCIFEKLQAQSRIIIEEDDDFFANEATRRFLTCFGVKSMVGCAIANDQNIEGFIGFIDASVYRKWTGIELDTMGELTNLLVPVITMDKEKKEQKQLLLQMIASADEANKAKSRFLSHMSHEIRTPLNAIIGMTFIAKKCVTDTEKVKDCIQKIENSSEYLLGIVNDILDMSKIENGEMEIMNEVFSLSALISDVREIMYSQAKMKQIDFQVIHQVREYQLKGDRMRLLEILINIISNAIKFTKPQGFVKLSIQERYKEGLRTILQFEIADNGIGMDDAFQAQIFKPFSQARHKNASGGKGTGLGMAICKSLVGLMHGTIQLKSEPDKGTVFTVEIPFDTLSHEEEPAKVEMASVDLNHLAGKRILLVEDNEINLEIAKTMLEMNQFIVEAVGDGSEAVEIFLKQAEGYFDAILMDINMPVMNGMAATQKIRAMSKADAKTIKIIAMTANVFQEDIVKALASGMNDYLSKPVDMEKLLHVLYHNLT